MAEVKGTFEPPQGQKQDVEEAQQKVKLPPEPTPEDMVKRQTPTPPTEAQQPRSLMQTVPASLLFKDEGVAMKSQFRQDSDMGLLFRVIAQDSKVPEFWRELARSLARVR